MTIPTTLSALAVGVAAASTGAQLATIRIPIAGGLGLGGEMGPAEWGVVILSSLVIGAILGPRLYRDIQGWFRSDESA